MKKYISILFLICGLKCYGQFASFSDLAFSQPSSSSLPDPTNVTSATLFLRYQADLFTVYTNGASVTNLTDFSTNGRNGILSFGTGNLYSNNVANNINNRAWIQCGSSTYSTNFTQTTGTNTYFVVCTPPSSGSGGFVFDGRGGERQILLEVTGMRAFAGAELNFSSPAAGAWTVWTFKAAGANSFIKTNNVIAASGDAGANNMGGITMFGRLNDINYYDGKFAVILMYNGALNSADETLIYNYLNGRYGPF